MGQIEKLDPYLGSDPHYTQFANPLSLELDKRTNQRKARIPLSLSLPFSEMAGKLLSLHTAPTSKFTTITSSSSRCASNSLFLSPVSVTIPSIRPLQLERRNRILVPVPRAGGPPSTGSLLFAFFLPLSLLVGTILATLRVGKQLDQKFLEEVNRLCYMF